MSERISMYPNPTAGTFYCRLGESVEAQLVIYTILGQETATILLFEGENKIILDDRKGIYPYKIMIGKNVVKTGKIVVR
jgi:hypothetical protein